MYLFQYLLSLTHSFLWLFTIFFYSANLIFFSVRLCLPVNTLYHTEHPTLATFLESLDSWKKEEQCHVLSCEELMTQQISFSEMFLMCRVQLTIKEKLCVRDEKWQHSWLRRSATLNLSSMWELPEQFHRIPLPGFHTEQFLYNCFTMEPGHCDV